MFSMVSICIQNEMLICKVRNPAVIMTSFINFEMVPTTTKHNSIIEWNIIIYNRITKWHTGNLSRPYTNLTKFFRVFAVSFVYINEYINQKIIITKITTVLRNWNVEYFRERSGIFNVESICGLKSSLSK